MYSLYNSHQNSSSSSNNLLGRPHRHHFFARNDDDDDGNKKETLLLIIYDDLLKSNKAFAEMIGHIELTELPINTRVINIDNFISGTIKLKSNENVKNVLVLFFTCKSYQDESNFINVIQSNFSDKTIYHMTINFVENGEYDEKYKNQNTLNRYFHNGYGNYKMINNIHALQFVRLFHMNMLFKHIKDIFQNIIDGGIKFTKLFFEDALKFRIYKIYLPPFDDDEDDELLVINMMN